MESEGVDLQELQQIILLLKEEDLTEITVWNGDSRITVRRDSCPRIPSPGDRTTYADVPERRGDMITAPLLGTFYSRSSPEEEPFVSEGDEIAAGETLCIIDAMKVMNEIRAEFSGRISKILVKDGDPVQYGQPLFLLENR
jgi:biotin carboxyl carrier protein